MEKTCVPFFHFHSLPFVSAKCYLIAHCLAHRFSGEKNPCSDTHLKYCHTVNQNWMPINIIHIHLAFCSPINSIWCWIFSIISTFKGKNHQTITQNLEQTQPNTKANKDFAVLLNMPSALNPHYSTRTSTNPPSRALWTIQNEVGQMRNSTCYELPGHPPTSTTPLSQFSSFKDQVHSETARDAELTGPKCSECYLLTDVMCC